jgi:hypothetical protein
MLLKVRGSDPWYANVINFMVAGYVPPGENKRKLIHESHLHLWDEPSLYRVCADGLLRRCVPVEEAIKIIEICHSSPYEGHLGHSALMLRSSKVDSSGQPCMMTPKNLYGGESHVRNMGVSMQETPCHSPPISS